MTSLPWPERLALIAIWFVALAPRSAHADRYEAQWSARPLVGMAQAREEGATSNERALAGGLSLGLTYGLSNRLDVGGELVALGTATSTFADTIVEADGGTTVRGPMTRRAGTALLLLGPTWRFGVSWVPVVTIAVGGGVRYRSAGRFTETDFVPGEKAMTTVLDLGATARLGFEHRVNRRLTMGAYVSAIGAWSPSAPLLPMVTASVGLSYVHYPSL